MRLVNAGAAFVAPLISGALATHLASRELSLGFAWVDPAVTVNVPTLSLKGLDFIFLATVLLGFFALKKLAALKEEGSVAKGVVLQELTASLGRTGFRIISLKRGKVGLGA
jgi:hypothetical protein